MIVGFGTGENSTSNTTSQLVGALGCSSVWSASKSLLAPATPTDATPGQVSWWVLVSSDTAGDVLLTLVTNTGGSIHGADIVILSGSCTSTFTEFGGILSSAVDSSTAVQSADAAGGSTFLSEHPGATEELVLAGSYWAIDYTTCTPDSTGGTGTQFAVALYAENGTVGENLGTTPTSC